jgi:parvulin-like peptidyl-prolyl isomerase
MQRSLRTLFPLLASISVGVGLGVAACRREEPSAPLPSKAVAVIDGTIISPEGLVEEIGRQGYTNAWDSAVESCLEEMIRFEVVYAKAKQEGFDKSPKVQASIRSSRPTGVPTETSQAVQAPAIKQIVVDRFLETHLGLDATKLPISDAEIQAYFRKNPDEFSTPPQAHGSIIFVRVSPDSSPEQRETLKKRAESIRAAAIEQRDPKVFASLARQHSDDPTSRSVDGDMGWVRRDAANQWPESVVRVLFELKDPGDVSPVVTTPDGFHVVRLIKYRPASVAQWTEVRERIRSRLAEKKEEERANQFFASLKAGVRIQINRPLVDAIKQELKTNAPVGQLQAPPGNPNR